jgi:hypothetical protein
MKGNKMGSFADIDKKLDENKDRTGEGGSVTR